MEAYGPKWAPSTTDCMAGHDYQLKYPSTNSGKRSAPVGQLDRLLDEHDRPLKAVKVEHSKNDAVAMIDISYTSLLQRDAEAAISAWQATTAQLQEVARAAEIVAEERRGAEEKRIGDLEAKVKEMEDEKKRAEEEKRKESETSKANIEALEAALKQKEDGRTQAKLFESQEREKAESTYAAVVSAKAKAEAVNQELQQQLDTFSEERKQAEITYAAVVSARDNAEAANKQLQQQLNDISAARDAANARATDATSAKAVAIAENKKLRDSLKRSKKRASDISTTAQTRMDEQQAQLDSLNNEIEKFDQHQKESMQFYESEYKKAFDEFQKVNDDREKAHRSTQDKLDSTQDKLKEVGQELHETQNELADLKEKIGVMSAEKVALLKEKNAQHEQDIFDLQDRLDCQEAAEKKERELKAEIMKLKGQLQVNPASSMNVTYWDAMNAPGNRRTQQYEPFATAEEMNEGQGMLGPIADEYLDAYDQFMLAAEADMLPDNFNQVELGRQYWYEMSTGDWMVAYHADRGSVENHAKIVLSTLDTNALKETFGFSKFGRLGNINGVSGNQQMDMVAIMCVISQLPECLLDAAGKYLSDDEREAFEKRIFKSGKQPDDVTPEQLECPNLWNKVVAALTDAPGFGTAAKHFANGAELRHSTFCTPHSFWPAQNRFVDPEVVKSCRFWTDEEYQDLKKAVQEKRAKKTKKIAGALDGLSLSAKVLKPERNKRMQPLDKFSVAVKALGQLTSVDPNKSMKKTRARDAVEGSEEMWKMRGADESEKGEKVKEGGKAKENERMKEGEKMDIEIQWAMRS